MTDNNKLWHTAEEQPKAKRYFLVFYKDPENGVDYTSLEWVHKSGLFFVFYEGTQRWCYLDDLLSLSKDVKRWGLRHILDVMALKTWKKDYERLKSALEEIASGKHDMNKLIGIAIKALAEDKHNV